MIYSEHLWLNKAEARDSPDLAEEAADLVAVEAITTSTEDTRSSIIIMTTMMTIDNKRQN